jgi:hypothetical protein
MKIERNSVSAKSADVYSLTKRISNVRSETYGLYMSFTRRKLREHGLITDSFSQELPITTHQHPHGLSSRDILKSFKRLGSVFTKNLEKEMPFLQGLKMEFVTGKTNSLNIGQVELFRWKQKDKDPNNISLHVSAEKDKHNKKWTRYFHYLNKKAIQEQLPVRFVFSDFISYEETSDSMFEGTLYINVSCHVVFWYRKDWIYGELNNAGINTGTFTNQYMKVSRNDAKISGQDLGAASGLFTVDNFDQVPDESKFAFNRTQYNVKIVVNSRVVVSSESSVWASSGHLPMEKYPYLFPKFSTVERVFNYLPEFKKILKTLARKLSYVPETFYVGDSDIPEPQ